MKLLKSLAHSGIELLGINHLTRFLTRRQSRILMYHRIIDHPLIPAITPAQFEQHLQYLSRHFNVIPINELLERRNSDTLADNSISITFDDGHYDFYENAWPLLKKYSLPATLYVTTGFIDRECWLWPDLIKYILSQTKHREILYQGENLSLTSNNILNIWDKIATDCLQMSNEDRSKFIIKLATSIEVDINTVPSDLFSAVTWRQLSEMLDEGLDIGSHTVSHRIMSKLSTTEKEMECVASKITIETKLSTKISGLCYPNGQPEDVDNEMQSIAERSGYSYAVLAYPAQSSNNKYQIGRQAAPSSIQPLRRILDGISRQNSYDR